MKDIIELIKIFFMEKLDLSSLIKDILLDLFDLYMIEQVAELLNNATFQFYLAKLFLEVYNETFIGKLFMSHFTPIMLVVGQIPRFGIFICAFVICWVAIFFIYAYNLFLFFCLLREIYKEIVSFFSDDGSNSGNSGNSRTPTKKPKNTSGKTTCKFMIIAIISSPLEIFEITTFDILGFELNETYAFSFFSILTAFTIGNLVAGETTIEEEEDEDFEDEDFTMDATDALITDNLGDNNDEELDTVIQTIFQSVLFSNLANLIPFGDSNSNYLIFTLYLAGTCFLALNFNGFLIHTFNMVQLFLPQGVPSFLRPLLFVIEFISYFARLFSLGIRLFANMLSGHILMAILSTFAVILLVGLNFGSFASIVLLIIITCIFFLETIISYLQAYVFGMLVTIYYGDALNLHH